MFRCEIARKREKEVSFNIFSVNCFFLFFDRSSEKLGHYRIKLKQFKYNLKPIRGGFIAKWIVSLNCVCTQQMPEACCPESKFLTFNYFGSQKLDELFIEFLVILTIQNLNCFIQNSIGNACTKYLIHKLCHLMQSHPSNK